MRAARVRRVAPEPVVVVCTNRSPAAVAEALEALRSQVPDEQIVLVCSGLSPDAVEAHRSATGRVAVLEEPRPGLSLARNRALAWAAGQDVRVIAYVDDDAVIGDGWWGALSRRWSESDGRVAVIG